MLALPIQTSCLQQGRCRWALSSRTLLLSAKSVDPCSSSLRFPSVSAQMRLPISGTLLLGISLILGGSPHGRLPQSTWALTAIRITTKANQGMAKINPRVQERVSSMEKLKPCPCHCLTLNILLVQLTHNIS